MPREIEASVQMRLYTLSKRRFSLVFVIFFFCFIMSVVVGLLGPSVIYTDIQTKKWGEKVSEKAVSYSVRTSLPLSSFNQQVWLLASPVPLKDEEVTPGDINTTVNVFGVVDGIEKPAARQSQHTRHIECTNKNCTTLLLMHLGYIEYETYKVTVEFTGLAQLGKFNSVIFQYKCYRSPFTQFEIWFRFAFLVLSFIITIWFSRSLRPYAWKDWAIEQKWMTFLLPLLLLYNNPLFTLSFIVKGFLPTMFDGIFQATFLSSLLLFWLCIYHSIRVQKRRFLKFYLPKLILVGLIWLASVVLSTWQSVNERTDPTFNYKVDTINFMGFKIFLFTIAGVYTLFLFYFIVRAIVELRNLAYFDVRLKFTTILIVIVFGISLAILVLRFGTGILNENFISDISTKYSSSAEFLSFYGLLNFYIYTMAFVYSPSKNALLESRLHDNPIVTMLDDSDEDVMYGSDRDDARKASNTEFMGRFDADSD